MSLATVIALSLNFPTRSIVMVLLSIDATRVSPCSCTISYFTLISSVRKGGLGGLRNITSFIVNGGVVLYVNGPTSWLGSNFINGIPGFVENSSGDST